MIKKAKQLRQIAGNNKLCSIQLCFDQKNCSRFNETAMQTPAKVCRRFIEQTENTKLEITFIKVDTVSTKPYIVAQPTKNQNCYMLNELSFNAGIASFSAERAAANQELMKAIAKKRTLFSLSYNTYLNGLLEDAPDGIQEICCWGQASFEDLIDIVNYANRNPSLDFFITDDPVIKRLQLREKSFFDLNLTAEIYQDEHPEFVLTSVERPFSFCYPLLSYEVDTVLKLFPRPRGLYIIWEEFDEDYFVRMKSHLANTKGIPLTFYLLDDSEENLFLMLSYLVFMVQ